MTEELTKDTMRTEAIRHRDRIDPSDPSECIESACELFMETFKPTKDMIVALYYPKGREFSTAALMDELQQNGVKCALPVVKEGSRILEFYTWHDGEAL
ncbi:MAG: 5-formyltetrahydrofolate cyclo-ligase, partial [Pseudomonadota bacterium]|nr:5-formyltetrahydrofolate cyclo-ligase [Pseudomonadota bacterium]